MKQLNILLILSIGILFTMSCRNQDIEFPDYDYTTVYFPYQFPVRTIVLGEDIYDNTLDNEHKCEIYASMGGVYSNKQKIDIDITVDNPLCDNLYYDSDFENPVIAMPSSYYTLASNKITLDGTLQGAVQVQLTDAFFADPNAIRNTYVIPLRMTNVVNADSILSGRPKEAEPIKVYAPDWDIQPKDFVLYSIKYINPWHANYLRRGEDLITEPDTSYTNVRRKEFVERDEVVKISTASMNSVEFPVTIVNTSDENQTCTLLLTFDEAGNCSISSLTNGFTASGTGSFVKKGEKNSWGDKDRDAIYLDYTIDMGGKSYATKDTLVFRDRGVKMEVVAPFYKFN